MSDTSLDNKKSEHWLKWSPRPLGMMVAVLTFLYSGIGISIINGILITNGVPAVFPPVDISTQNNLMVILLGIGYMRTMDKKVK